MLASQGNFRRTGRYRIYMNVGYVLDEAQLTRYFSQFGTVTDCYLPKHKSGRNKGFGFTTFEAEKDLECALQAAEHVIEGVMVKINRAGPRPEHEHPPDEKPQTAPNLTATADACPGSPTGAHGRGPRLYVGGVPDEITEEDIVEHFNKWGQVVDCYFPGKKGAKRVNYCFITFENWRSAQRACNQSERNIHGKALQSISMAEERQGEAHADGLAKLSSMQASAALQQAFALASTANAVSNNVAGYGGFAPAPAPAAPENGLAALQTLLANGLVAPNAVSSLIAALAGTPEMPRQQPAAPAALKDPGLAAALPLQGTAQQGMTASTLNSLAALLAEYQSSQAAAGGPAVARAVGPMDPISDPLASLDASIRGAFSPGNVSLLKPWGQHMPEMVSTSTDGSGSSSPTSPPGVASPKHGPLSKQGEEAESQVLARRANTLPERASPPGNALRLSQQARAASLSATPTHVPGGFPSYQTALASVAGPVPGMRPAGSSYAHHAQMHPRSAAQPALLQGMPGSGNFTFQPDIFQQPAEIKQPPALGLPFSPYQPAAPVLPAAFSTLNGQPGGCKPAPYHAYPAADPARGMQSMASSPDDGLRVAEGCLRLLAI